MNKFRIEFNKAKETQDFCDFRKVFPTTASEAKEFNDYINSILGATSMQFDSMMNRRAEMWIVQGSARDTLRSFIKSE